MIASAANPKIKHIRQLLRSRKTRMAHRQTVLEGIHLLQAALEHHRLPEMVLIPESRLKNSEINTLCQRLPENTITIISDELAHKISELNNANEIITLIALPQPNRLPESGDCILLDAVQDPGNVGTILRCALAANVRHIILSQGSADAYSPKVLRAGMGAHFALNIYENIDLTDFIQHYSGSLYATTLHHPKQKNLYELNLHKKSAWIFGNEGAGISQEILKRVDYGVHIPISSASESLNVAMAATVCLFEQARQRHSGLAIAQ